MPIATEAPGAKKIRYKMRLLQDEYLSEHDGHCPAGSVLIVDEETAERWYERRIAEPAGSGEKTIREIKREANLKRLRASVVEVDEQDGPGIMPQPMRRGGRRVVRTEKPDLRGAGVINDLTDTPDDDAFGGEADET